MCGIVKIEIGNILHPSSNVETNKLNIELMNTGLKYIQIDGESDDDLAKSVFRVQKYKKICPLIQNTTNGTNTENT